MEPTSNQKRLAALAEAEKLGEEMGDAFARTAMVQSRGWDGSFLPEISLPVQTPTPPAIPREPSRSVQNRPEEEKPSFQSPNPPRTREESVWTPQWPSIRPAILDNAPMAAQPAMAASVGWSEIPSVSRSREGGVSSPPASYPSASAVPLARGNDATGGGAFTRPVSSDPMVSAVNPPSVPPIQPAIPQVPPVPRAEPFSMAVDTFRQATMGSPSPPSGFMERSKKQDEPQWATELIAAVKELTREMGEADEDETEEGENQSRRESKELPDVWERADGASAREVFSSTLMSDGSPPSRPQPPITGGSR